MGISKIAQGQRLRIADIVAEGIKFELGLAAHGLTLDFACFGLDAAGKLTDDRYMTFFNQPQTPCGGVILAMPAGDQAGFAFQLDRLPATIEKLVITASVDGNNTMSQMSSGYLRFLAGNETARFAFSGTDFADERALVLGELYRKDNVWRFSAVGQGFNGGLDALVRHFGGVVDESSPGLAAANATKTEPAAPSAPAANRISLEKRVAREAPQLVSLVKQATVSLEKVGLSDHRAKVCLCLDISGSMSRLYSSGAVQTFTERILALGCRFDDDAEIDVFLFGAEVHQPAPLGLQNCRDYVRGLNQRYPLEGDTRYGAAIEAIRRHYFPDAGGRERKTPIKATLPVYVMFVTDGSTSDRGVTEKQLRWASFEPIFWQFMGIGKGRKSKGKKLSAFASSDFPFLEKLDDLDGRFIDNANFFSVESPSEHGDEALYDLLMTEYPQWLKLARRQGLLR